MCCARLPKDVWTIISFDLSTWDLLNLRKTCKDINNKVKNMHKKWYQSHQWLLFKNRLFMKLDSSLKHHPNRLSINCGIYWREKGWSFNINTTREMIKDGRITKSDCHKSDCWTFKHIKSEKEIPLDDFKPNNHKYIYVFLIESYRIKHAKQLKTSDEIRKKCKNFQREIDDRLSSIEHHKCEIKKLKVKKDRAETYKDLLREKMKKNEIFKNKRIKTYQGP